MGRPDRVEACGVGGERIHPKQNKGDRGLLDTRQGGSGQGSRGETICQEVVIRGCS